MTRTSGSTSRSHIRTQFDNRQRAKPRKRLVQTPLRSPSARVSEWGATHVLHAIKGRVRLKVPALKRYPHLVEPFVKYVQACAGVRQVWANQNCASLIIVFDPNVNSTASLRDVLAQVSSQTLRTRSPGRHTSRESAPPADNATFELLLSTAGLACVAAEFIASPVVPLLLLGSALPMIRRAFERFGRRDVLTVDVLDASATTLLACQGQWPMALFMVWLVNLGDYIRDVTVMRAQNAVTEVLAYRRTPAWVLRMGKTVQIDVDQVKIGETVVVYPGERIPIDGTVVQGAATVDQQALTGESLPVHKTAGDLVYAATVVQDGKVYIRADRVGDETEAARIVRLVQDAPAHETRIQNYAERWANDLVPYSFLGAGLNGLLSQNMSSSASVLIIDYGTGIRIAAPTTVLASITKAIRHGILIKGGRYMEQLAAVDAVVFDKTGTLTAGSPTIMEMYAYNGVSQTDVLGFAAACEQRLTHPVAKAIEEAAHSRGVTIPERRHSRYTIGLGVEAHVNGALVRVGSERFLVAKRIAVPGVVQRHLDELRHAGMSPVIVAMNGEIVGTLACADPVRPESARVVAQLREYGIRHIAMVTGDHARVAAKVAESVGISEVVADALPQDKLAYVKTLQQQGRRVAVVGDGINDSPALAHADVGIAVSGGADVAEATAHIVLLQGGLWKVPLAMDISRDALALIEQNWKIISIPNTVALGLAVFGAIGAGVATILSNGSALLATANALRPLMTSAPVARGEDKVK